MLTYRVFAPIILIGSVLIEAPSIACSCLPTPTVQEALESADAVFTGEVTAIRIAPRWWQDGSVKPSPELVRDSSRNASIVFAVDRAWKGVSEEILIVTTPFDCCACGATFNVGDRYLIFASRDSATKLLSTNTCMRNSVVSEKPNTDLGELGTPPVDFESPRMERMFRRMGVPRKPSSSQTSPSGQ